MTLLAVLPVSRASARSLLGRLARRLAGSTVSAALLAGAFAALAASGTAAPFLLTAAPAPSEQHAYVVKVTNKGDFADSDATILAVVDTALQRWVVESDHVISAFTRVGGLHPLATATDCTDPGALWREARQLFPGVDFGGASGNHLIVLGPAACPSGHGTVGGSLHSGGLVTVRYNPDSSPQTLLHELGHNFGLEHDHALKCAPACTDVTYGNEYSFMGFTTPHHPAYVPGALDSYQRQLFGIDDHCEIRQARLADGQAGGRATYVLAPRGTDDGARGVRVVDPQSGTVYFLDFRNGAGRDAGAYYVSSPSFREGVTVEKVTTDADGDAVTQLQSVPDARYGAVYSEVAGQTFQAGGVTVHVDQLGVPDDPAATATVTVTLESAPGSDTAAALPDGCEAEGVVPPTAAPTDLPTGTPTVQPTVVPPVQPTGTPTPALPSVSLSTALPTSPATALPTAVPTAVPTAGPTAGPTLRPTVLPTNLVSAVATALPTNLLSAIPTALPTNLLSAIATVLPTSLATVPSVAPTDAVTPTVPGPTEPSLPAPTVSAPTGSAPAAPLPSSSPAGTSEPTTTPSTTSATPAQTPASTPTPTATPTPAAPQHEPPDDTVRHVPSPPRHGDLPSTGSPRLLLLEIAVAAFLLGLGLVLVLAARRPTARRAGRGR